MAISKVILDGSTLLDVTNSTVNSQRILSGYTAKGADGVDVTGAYVPPTFATQSKTATPSESQQTVEPDSGYDGLSSVTVGAISSTYVGSGITRRSSTDLTASGATVTVPSGYYQSQATKSVTSGSAGTPTATKGSVSNHSVSVTPSVTNTTGYITGGTVSGTAVSVSASELVSGSETKTANGTYDVTNLAELVVNVSGGDDSNFAHTISRSGAITSIPNGVTSIGDYAFYGCAGLNVASLPNTVESIGTYAFYGCTSLALTALPESYFTIGTYAFSGCTSMPLASFGSLFTSSVPASAFYNCKAITSLDCANTTSIAANAFNGCNALTTLVLRRSIVCTLANISAFSNTPLRGYGGLTGTVYVPSSLISSYQTAGNWSTLYGNNTVTFSAIEGSKWEL